MRRTLGVIAVVLLTVAGCSSSSHSAASQSAATTVPTPAVCHPSAPAPVNAAHPSGPASEYDLTSFDGTRIRMHWFPLSHEVPTVLKGPGWGQAGDTNTSGSGYGLFGDLSIKALQSAGYNVLTWDPRGFGKSSGTIEIDSVDFEARDVQRIIDWVAQQPNVQLDSTGDPRLGMVGASYGGGIQLVAAAIDCRVDAIVPQIAWHSLTTSLFENDTVKRGWGDLLYAAAAGRKLDPHITSAHEDGDATGVVSADVRKWFADRGPADLVSRINVPTLFEQGTIDTLFPLDEAVANYTLLTAKHVPTAMLWMCSGHGVCLTKPGDTQAPGQAAINWLDRYVMKNAAAQAVPLFSYVDQNGVTHRADAFPLPAGEPITASGNGTLTLVAGGGAGPAVAKNNAGALGSAALPITPSKATHAVNVPIPLAAAANIVGAPQLSLTYSGTVPAGTRPTRVFAQLVDDATGIVVGNQITPVPVVLDGQSHTTDVPLEMIAFSATPGAHLTLQLAATTPAYGLPRLGGSVQFSAIKVQLPTVNGVDAA
jgi:ABC-2 type transport system ATP-binding protein